MEEEEERFQELEDKEVLCKILPSAIIETGILEILSVRSPKQGLHDDIS